MFPTRPRSCSPILPRRMEKQRSIGLSRHLLYTGSNNLFTSGKQFERHVIAYDGRRLVFSSSSSRPKVIYREMDSLCAWRLRDRRALTIETRLLSDAGQKQPLAELSLLHPSSLGKRRSIFGSILLSLYCRPDHRRYQPILLRQSG